MVIDNYDGMVFPLPKYNFASDENYVFFGTGEVAKSYYTQLLDVVSSDCISFFVDSMSKENELFGKKICKLDDIPVASLNDYKYVLCTYTSSVSMENELIKRGVEKENIIKSLRYTLDSFVEYKVHGGKICLYPAMKKEDFEQVKKKIDDYIVEDSNITFEAVVDDIVELKSKHINCVGEYESLEKYDIVFVWNKKSLQDDIIKNIDNAFCIDETFFQMIDIKIMSWLNYKYQTVDDVEKFDRISKKNFSKLVNKKYQKGYVFGTGPSMKEGMEICLEHEQKTNGLCKIVCNTAINSIDYLDKVKPNIYVISDSIFLAFEYKDMLERIIDYVNKHDMVLCIPCFWMPICLQKYKLDEEKVVGFHEMKRELCFPNQDDLELYSKAHNVITKYAIPIASALTDEILISGCDGARMLDNGDLVYDHADAVVATNKKNEVLNHYAFFRQIVEYGESKGKHYCSITKSYVPALQERMYTY